MCIQTLMTKRLEVPIISIIAAAVSVALLVKAATHSLRDFVSTQG